MTARKTAPPRARAATRKARPAPRAAAPARRAAAKLRAASRSAGPPRRAAAKPRPAPARSRTAAAPPRPKEPAAGRVPDAVPSGRTPDEVGLVSVHMDYSSHQLDEVRSFYTGVLGLRNFRYDEKMQYLFVTTGPGSSLGFSPPTGGLPEDWRPPREPSIYLFVEDVDLAHARLVERGVEFLQPPADMPWGHRVARLRDPEGRLVCIASPVKKES